MGTTLSVIIPAYNEAERLPATLDDVRIYLDEETPESYEVIVVDDGSRDATAGVVEGRFGDWPQLRLLRHPHNRGKGAAVRDGILVAVSAVVLCADADGATPIAEERRLRAAIAAGADLAVGSRHGRGPDTVVARAAHRAAFGRAFAALARLAVPMAARDPQCGFKMFRREVGQRLVRLGREDGYLLDTEVLGLALRLGYRVAEVGISWREVAGSKISLATDVPRMAIGLARVRRSVAARGVPEDPAASAATSVPGPVWEVRPGRALGGPG